MKHSLSTLTARNIPVSDFFSQTGAKSNYLLIVNHFAILCFFATERPQAFLSLAIIYFAKKVLLCLFCIYYQEKKHCLTSGEAQIYSRVQLQQNFTSNEATCYFCDITLCNSGEV